MKWAASTKPWIFALLFAVFIFTIFYTGEHNKSQAASKYKLPSPLSYKLVSTEVLQVPLFSSNKEHSIIKGMVITQASTQAEFIQIAHHIKERYAEKHIDSIELTIHNENNGWFEDENMLYEPISKGTISIAYTSLGHAELQIPQHESILIKLNN